MTNVGLTYNLQEVDFNKTGNLTDGNLEKIINLTGGIKTGRGVVQSQYPDVEMGVGILENRDSIAYSIFFNGKKERLGEAIAAFIESGGVPNFISGGYDIVEPILQQYGKRLQRKFTGLIVGKYVVDMH